MNMKVYDDGLIAMKVVMIKSSVSLYRCVTKNTGMSIGI